MRYQDWDVLLFPDGSSVPIQEFRTASFLVQENDSRTPTLVTYVPSLAVGTPFAISLHSWTKPTFSTDLNTLHKQSGTGNMAWGIRLIIDNAYASSSTMLEPVAWPQVINSADQPVSKSQRNSLLFPPFNRKVLSRRDWDIADGVGRIKVVLSEGIRTLQDGQVCFRPRADLVCFSFQPAPIEYLQKCNIAWPNQSMFDKPWSPQAQREQNVKPTSSNHCLHPWSSQQYSPQQAIGRPWGTYPEHMAAPPTPQRLPFSTSLSHPFPDFDSLSSRATSLSSNNSAWQEQLGFPFAFQMDGADDRVRHGPPEANIVRLPSDQIRQIVGALTNAKSLPSATAVKTNRARNTSDITMHAGCTAFPICTSIDSDGEITHRSPYRAATKYTSKSKEAANYDTPMTTSTGRLRELGATKPTGPIVAKPAFGKTIFLEDIDQVHDTIGGSVKLRRSTRKRRERSSSIQRDGISIPARKVGRFANGEEESSDGAAGVSAA